MELNKVYLPLFERYGSLTKTAEFRQGYHCLRRPDVVNSIEEVAAFDKDAARIIEECQTLIEQMTAYRQDLTLRYGELSTMSNHTVVKLERYRGYNGISYYIRFTTVYEDGTEFETAHEAFTGKERHKAIARFKELKKLHKNYEFIEDIAKKEWEK